MNLEEVDNLYTSEQTTKKLTTKEYKDKYVNLDVTMKACKECPVYSQNWACPEFKTDPLKNWEEYDNIELIFTKINFTQEAISTKYNMEEMGYIIENTLFLERNKLIPKLEEKEKELNGKYLSAGSCTYCEKCSRIENKSCKYPDKCHNSIESIGGLVSDTIEEEFNETIKWIDVENGKLPENLSLLMAVLY